MKTYKKKLFRIVDNGILIWSCLENYQDAQNKLNEIKNTMAKKYPQLTIDLKIEPYTIKYKSIA